VSSSLFGRPWKPPTCDGGYRVSVARVVGLGIVGIVLAIVGIVLAIVGIVLAVEAAHLRWWV